jgi:hypothetical protein
LEEGVEMHYAAPSGAVVRFRCEPATAARLSTMGLEVLDSDDGPIAELPCEIDSELFSQAAARCETQRVDGILVADLTTGALTLFDQNPLRRDYRDYQGRPAVWLKPGHRAAPLTPMRLSSSATLESLPGHLVRWFRQVPEVDPDALADALAAWETRVRELEHLVNEEAAAVRPLANNDDKFQLDRLLADIRRVILYGTHPDVDTEFGMDGPYLLGVSEVVSHQVARILSLVEQIQKAQADRERREKYEGEIERLVKKYLPNLSERLQMAVDADLLAESTGIARAELLELLRPGWAWVDREIKEVVNPPEGALNMLLVAQLLDSRIRLGYVSTGRKTGEYVLVAEFLGRPIFGKLDEVCLELPLEPDL